MKVFDLNTVRSVLDADPEVVRQVLVSGGWIAGPAEDAATFAEWLQRRSYEALDYEESERVLALALNYYTRRHPGASHIEVCSWACLIQELTSGWHAYPTEEVYPWEGWCKRVLAAAIGGQLDAEGCGVIPEWTVAGTPAPGHDPDALTRLFLGLSEALYTIARPEAEWQATVREVVDLLAQSKHTFRSKQIERARQLLDSLLA